MDLFVQGINNILNPSDPLIGFTSEFETSNTPKYFKSSTQQCNVSNDTIAYLSKQWVMLTKMYDIITQFTSGLNEDMKITQPEMLLIDASSILQDIHSGNPSESSLYIFSPESQLIGYVQGKPQYKLWTIVDTYNNFFINEFNTLSLQDIYQRAKDILNGILVARSKLEEILLNLCANNQSDYTISLYKEALSLAQSNPGRTKEIIQYFKAVNPDLAKRLIDEANNYVVDNNAQDLRRKILKLVSRVPPEQTQEFIDQLSKINKPFAQQVIDEANRIWKEADAEESYPYSNENVNEF